ncbi:glycerophosphodiester phosphodiesterase [Aeromicrobium sp. NPDC092404]|uniref:glycerophosphodiester phosphodiesterase n=1 Tax=Aeromicrobium sp. NPDC092404 TaxID=3154976 RepID=UPI0034270BAB
MPLVSAHRGGAADDRSAQNTLAAFESAIALGCDYVEFDVRLTADGRPVIFHDDEIDDDTITRSISRHRHDEFSPDRLVDLDTVLALIRGRVRAHVDLKVRGDDLVLVQQIVTMLGTDQAIITTAEDSSVRRIRRWSKTHAPDLLVGLSSSPRSGTANWFVRKLVRIESAFPRLRVRLSGANLVVSHKIVARLSLKTYARKRGLPLLVWTVDKTDELERWMNDPDVWMVATNYPARAIAARQAAGA